MKEITTPIERTPETHRKQYTYSLTYESHTYLFQNSSIIPQLGDLHWLCTLRQSTHDWDSHGQGSTHEWSRGVPAGALLPTGLWEQGAFLLRAWDLVWFSGVSVCLLSAIGIILTTFFRKALRRNVNGFLERENPWVQGLLNWIWTTWILNLKWTHINTEGIFFMVFILSVKIPLQKKKKLWSVSSNFGLLQSFPRPPLWSQIMKSVSSCDFQRQWLNVRLNQIAVDSFSKFQRCQPAVGLQQAPLSQRLGRLWRWGHHTGCNQIVIRRLSSSLFMFLYWLKSADIKRGRGFSWGKHRLIWKLRESTVQGAHWWQRRRCPWRREARRAKSWANI